MKQIEVKFDAKAKDVLANTLDLGGSSLIEVPAHSKLTLDGNKLLQLLISKNVDVDAEVELTTDWDPYTGILLGGVVSLGAYLHLSVLPHMIYAYYTEEGIGVKWEIDGDNGMRAFKEIKIQTALTYRNMLQALDTLTMEIYNSGIMLVPYVALKTSSQSYATPVPMSNDEFLSFITIEPFSETED